MTEHDDRVSRALDAIRVHLRSEAEFGLEALSRAARSPAPVETRTVPPVEPRIEPRVEPRTETPADSRTAPPAAPARPVESPTPRPTSVAAAAAPRSDFVPRVAPLRERLGSADARAALDALEADVAACTRCKLHATRTCTVPGEGHANPDLLFIGEGPGEEEDRSGRPFVGRAGELLTKIIGAMGFSRETVHIANIVKCRPPGNRVPEPDEIAACQPYLTRQIELLKPKLICTLGLPATRTILGITQGIKAARGREFVWNGIPVIPTFHPAYLLRNPDDKPLVWQDAQTIVRRLIGLGATLPNPDALKKFKDPPPDAAP